MGAGALLCRSQQALAACLPGPPGCPLTQAPAFLSPLLLFPAGVPGVKPVRIELTDFTTKEVVDELEVGKGRWCAGLCRL